MNFNPEWNTNAVYHHLAPQTYLRAWKHDDSRIFYVEKDSTDSQIPLDRGTKRLAGIRNYFTRNIHSLFRVGTDIEKYFEPLKSYKVFYLNQQLDTPIQMYEYFKDYNSWIIYDETENVISDDLKDNLRIEIEKIEIKDIEVGWAKIYEDNWPRLRETLVKYIMENIDKNAVESMRKKDLVMFMVSLEWRTRPVHPEIQKKYDELANLDILKEVLESQVDEDENYSFLKLERELMLHNILLSYYHKFLNNKGPIYNEVMKIVDNMTLEFLIADDSSEFITSDNPVCRFVNEENLVEYIFPLTPKIACTVRNGNSKYIKMCIITNLNKESVIHYNEKLKANAYKGYILREPNLELYFGDNK